MYYTEVDLMNNLDTLIASNYIVRFKPSRKEYLSIVDVLVLSWTCLRSTGKIDLHVQCQLFWCFAFSFGYAVLVRDNLNQNSMDTYATRYIGSK